MTYEIKKKDIERNYTKFETVDNLLKQKNNNPLNKRTRLFTGENCQYNCIFCYYKDRLHIKKSFEDIKMDIDILDPYFEEFDLSGGESSIHKNWFDILDYLKSKNKYISTLSNGSKFADYKFLKESQNRGLQEILFSVHGISEQHNNIVQHKNAFDKILQAIKNSFNLGIKIRVNTTITNLNIRQLKDIIEIINTYKIDQWNLLPLNYWEDSNNDSISLQNSKDEFNNQLKIIKKELNKQTELNIRYLPYCFLEDNYFKDNIKNMYHHIFDLRDWCNLTYNVNDFKEHCDLSLKKRVEYVIKERKNSFYKNKECFECSFFDVCDGYKIK